MTLNIEDALFLESGNTNYAEIANSKFRPRVKSVVTSTAIMLLSAIATYYILKNLPKFGNFAIIVISTGTLTLWSAYCVAKTFYSTYIGMEYMRITDDGVLAVYTWIPSFFSRKRVEFVNLKWNEIKRLGIIRLMDEGADYHRVCFEHDRPARGFKSPPVFMWPLGIHGDQSESRAQELLKHFQLLIDRSQ
jgi:hypothetical protein